MALFYFMQKSWKLVISIIRNLSYWIGTSDSDLLTVLCRNSVGNDWRKKMRRSSEILVHKKKKRWRRRRWKSGRWRREAKTESNSSFAATDDLAMRVKIDVWGLHGAQDFSENFCIKCTVWIKTVSFERIWLWFSWVKKTFQEIKGDFQFCTPTRIMSAILLTCKTIVPLGINGLDAHKSIKACKEEWANSCSSYLTSPLNSSSDESNRFKE